jgi:hypothetical protein
MNVEIWLEDTNGEYETVKITGESANNFKVPQVGTECGAWQDDAMQLEVFVLLYVVDVRHFIYRKSTTENGDQTQKMPVWTQEIHILCSKTEPRRGRR